MSQDFSVDSLFKAADLKTDTKSQPLINKLLSDDVNFPTKGRAERTSYVSAERVKLEVGDKSRIKSSVGAADKAGDKVADKANDKAADKASDRAANKATDRVSDNLVDKAATRDRYSRSIDKYLDTLTKSLPARDGESFYQVLERTLPRMKDHELKTLSHDVSELNKINSPMSGQQFEILSDYGKNILKTRLMTEFDKDHNEGNNSETKIRSKFNPAYDHAMKAFGERITKAADAEIRLTRSELSPVLPARPLPRDYRRQDDDRDSDSAEKPGSRIEQLSETKRTVLENAAAEKTPENALTDFADACHKFAQSTDELIFLGKWYSPESSMYKWGEQEFFSASQKSHEAFEQLQMVVQTQQERARLQQEWEAFICRQKDNLNNMHKQLPLIDEAMVLDNNKS